MEVAKYPPDKREKVDPNVLAALPSVAKVLEIQYHGESAWAKATRLVVLHTDGNKESYFMKVNLKL